MRREAPESVRERGSFHRIWAVEVRPLRPPEKAQPDTDQEHHEEGDAGRELVHCDAEGHRERHPPA